MLWLSALLLVAQAVDLMWPRDDPRAGSPASLVFAAALAALLALYPNGRFTPRWTAVVVIAATALFAASLIVGPDVSSRFLWPLPIAPLLVALVVGGQGYRYVRRSTPEEREATRWPLLGVLLTLTVIVPTDVIAVLLTGQNATANPVMGPIVQVLLFLPGLGFLAGLLAPRTELVDRLLALWVTVVLSAAMLAAVFAVVLVVGGRWMPAPWPAWISAAAVAVASVFAIPLARRAGSRMVFRGRADQHAAVAVLMRRLRLTLDVADVPAEVAAAIAEAIGSEGLTLRRWGQHAVWAVAGNEPPAEGLGWRTMVTHLGLPLATVELRPRAGESALTSTDRRIVEAMAAAAAPALHGARLASAFPELTDRERQVLAGIVRGLPNAAIAQRLGVSNKTVANYVSIVLTKLRVPDKERAAEVARRRSAEFAD